MRRMTDASAVAPAAPIAVLRDAPLSFPAMLH